MGDRCGDALGKNIARMKLWFIFCQDDLLLQKTGEGKFTVPKGEEPPVVLKAWNNVHNITPMDDGTLVKTVRVDNPITSLRVMRCALSASLTISSLVNSI